MGDMLNEFNNLLQQEVNKKVKTAMQLFIRCDDVYRTLILHSTGFDGPLTAQTLREHFGTLDLIDMLDECIEDMRYEVEENNAG